MEITPELLEQTLNMLDEVMGCVSNPTAIKTILPTYRQLAVLQGRSRVRKSKMHEYAGVKMKTPTLRAIQILFKEEGKKIAAIKRLREDTGVGLLMAKAAVESIMNELGLPIYQL